MARRRGTLQGTSTVTGGGLPGGRYQPFRPYVPPLPPAGSYDPALDAQRAAAGRGLLDTRQDIELAGARAGQDYSFGVEDVRRSGARGSADLLGAAGRNTEDFGRATAELGRSFNILAGQQAQRRRQMGVSTGGAVLQAAAKRKANQTRQQGDLRLAFDRRSQDLRRAFDRNVEDTNIGVGRLGVGYTRGVTDRATALGRAERENTQFGLDVDAQRYYQAAGAGWEPPLPPRRRR